MMIHLMIYLDLLLLDIVIELTSSYLIVAYIYLLGCGTTVAMSVYEDERK